MIADDRQEIYRVKLTEGDQPRLSLARQASLEFTLLSRLAAIGTSVLGVVRGPASDQLVVLDTETLRVTHEHELDGRVTWGPTSVTEGVLVVIDDERVQFFDGEEEPRWETPAVAYGRPTGSPLLVDEDFVFASHRGTLWRISQASGREVAVSASDMQFTSAPMAYADFVLVADLGGVIHALSLPQGDE